MSTTFRPMLAAEYNPDKCLIQFPVFASPKIDGIRCVIRHGQPLTRSLKPIPNRHIRAALSGLPDFDGELIVGNPVDPEAWNHTSSAVMSHDGEPDFTYWVFDTTSDKMKLFTFDQRLLWAEDRVKHYAPNVKILKHRVILDLIDLAQYEELCVKNGYEGIMIRDVIAPYKWGRSTAKEGFLLKMKRFDDLEAEIIGAYERRHHVGEALINALGLTERDHKKENYVGASVLGGFVCRYVGLKWTSVFEVGSGFTDEQRLLYWNKGLGYQGTIVKIKHQGWTVENKPRFPVFLGFRDERDMG